MNDIIFTFSLTDLLLAVLILVGIVVLINLVRILANLLKITKMLSELFDENKEGINLSLKKLPTIVENVDGSIASANTLLKNSSQDIVESISATKTTLTGVSRISTDVADGLEYVTRTVADTADTVSMGISDASTKMTYIKEIIEIVSDILKKKR